MSFDFDAAVQAPFRMQPGLRRLAEGARQLTPSPPGGRHLREKLAVLACQADQALLARPGFDATPALAALSRHAALEHPDAWSSDEDGAAARAHRLGWQVSGGIVSPLDGALPEVGDCLRGLPAEWRLAALLALAFEEDFAIVDGRDASLPWLAVALPSHWAPEEKIGRRFAEVHGPVADNAVLVAAGAHLMRLVCGPDRWERFVWNIVPHPRLHAHPARVDPERWPSGVDATTIAGAAWWRTERQTFLPVGDGQAVFTIQVDVRPLAEALAEPGRAARVQAALASMSDAVLDYRGLACVRAPLLEWLALRAAG